MKPAEVAIVLGLASEFDNRTVDKGRVAAWHALLADVSFEDAKAVVLKHQTESSEYLNVGHIVNGVKAMNRLMPKQIAEDVRSARARGWVSGDWPESRELPADIKVLVAEARAGVRASQGALESSGGER